MTTRTPAGKRLADVTLRYQVYLERFKAGEVRKLDAILQEMDRAIRAALLETGDAPSMTRLRLMLAQLRKRLRTITERHAAAHLSTLRQLSGYATQFHAETLALVLPTAAPALTTPALAAVWAGTLATPVQATGELLEPFLAGWGRRSLFRVENAIRLGYAQGMTTQDILRLIRGTRAGNFRDGILGGITRHAAAAVVRTSIQQVSNDAQFAVYEANDDIVEGYQWVSTLDNRTSSQCRSLDGRIFYFKDKGVQPQPPIHVNCRSTTIPKLKGIDLTGVLRASKGAEGGEQVPASETYYTWLKRQPADFQDDVLGPTRAQLFRKGGLTAEEFARLELDKNFQPLTLEEMRKKNPAAFARAGIDAP